MVRLTKGLVGKAFVLVLCQAFLFSGTGIAYPTDHLRPSNRGDKEEVAAALDGGAKADAGDLLAQAQKIARGTVAFPEGDFDSPTLEAIVQAVAEVGVLRAQDPGMQPDAIIEALRTKLPSLREKLSDSGEASLANLLRVAALEVGMLLERRLRAEAANPIGAPDGGMMNREASEARAEQILATLQEELREAYDHGRVGHDPRVPEADVAESRRRVDDAIRDTVGKLRAGGYDLIFAFERAAAALQENDPLSVVSNRVLNALEGFRPADSVGASDGGRAKGIEAVLTQLKTLPDDAKVHLLRNGQGNTVGVTTVVALKTVEALREQPNTKVESYGRPLTVNITRFARDGGEGYRAVVAWLNSLGTDTQVTMVLPGHLRGVRVSIQRARTYATIFRDNDMSISREELKVVISSLDRRASDGGDRVQEINGRLAELDQEEASWRGQKDTETQARLNSIARERQDLMQERYDITGNAGDGGNRFARPALLNERLSGFQATRAVLVSP